MTTDELISDSITYEAYFDLWGFSVNWIKVIQEKLLDFAEPSQGENCEAYTCEACMAVRFQSPERERVNKAKALFRQMVGLARSSYSDREGVVYVGR